MQKKCKKNFSSFILCMMLIVAMASITTGCNGNAKNKAASAPSTDVSASADVTKLGEGNTSFPFTVVDNDGNLTQFEIHTDKETVGEALLELELIAGDDSAYGLYVKTVNGITADYDTDKTYWAFYIDGEYATTGVDTTPITAGSSYSLKVEK